MKRAIDLKETNVKNIYPRDILSVMRSQKRMESMDGTIIINYWRFSHVIGTTEIPSVPSAVNVQVVIEHGFKNNCTPSVSCTMWHTYLIMSMTAFCRAYAGYTLILSAKVEYQLIRLELIASLITWHVYVYASDDWPLLLMATWLVHWKCPINARSLQFN